MPLQVKLESSSMCLLLKSELWLNLDLDVRYIPRGRAFCLLQITRLRALKAYVPPRSRSHEDLLHFRLEIKFFWRIFQSPFYGFS